MLAYAGFMKIETLAKRIADKTRTPALEDFILGKRPITELPHDCMIWTGKKTLGGIRTVMDRDVLNIPVHYRTIRRSMGQIQINGKAEYVHRLVFKLLTKPDFEFHMRNICGNSLCCNPKHWDVSSPMPEVQFDNSEWTPEEAEETVEAMLARYEITSWDDVTANPLMQDIPPALIRQALIKLNKEHLT